MIAAEQIPDLERIRKARGAYFTPPAIADYLARWAIAGNPRARVLDPTCGDGVFLVSAGRQLLSLGAPLDDLDGRATGVDIHHGSLEEADRNLAAEGLTAHLEAADFFARPSCWCWRPGASG